MFRVGQKVVCVRDKPYEGQFFFPEEKLIKGNIYTVAAIGISLGVRAVQLAEVARVTNHPLSRPGIWGYNATRFRPIVERKTDISIFTALLNTKKMREPANG